MANELFKRVAIVKIGPTGRGKSASLSSVKPSILAGFRVAFEIGKTSESTPNQSKISIWNLSQANRSSLETRKDLSIELEVGYEGLSGSAQLSQIFIGDIKDARTERKGGDLITTIDAGDSETVIKETVVNETFAPNTTSNTVISTIAKQMDLAVGLIMPGITSVFENGLSIMGPAAKNLDVLTKQAGLEWNVVDGTLNILDKKSTTLEPAEVISAETGLLGFPSKMPNGVEFECLINTNLKPGRAVSLVSKNFTGLYRVIRCEFTGDTNEGAWVVKVEAGNVG